MKCFLDSDGLLADFEDHCVARFGFRPSEVSVGTLWAKIHEDAAGFWSSIPPFPGAETIVDLARPYGATVLTGCPYDPNDHKNICPIADKYKRLWIEKQFGPNIPVITCFTRSKPRYMENPGDLLVDDNLGNIEKWERAGGVGLLAATTEQTIVDLRRKIKECEHAV